MKNVIIFYQVINREKSSCEALKAKLEESNDVTAWVLSIDFELGFAVGLLKERKIDVVVMPWMYHNSNYFLMKPFIKNNPEIKIINLHHEQIASKASLNRMLPTGEYTKNSVIHFVWGEYFKQALIDVGVKKDQIYITGNMRADNTNSTIATRTKSEIAKEFGLDLNKKWLLFSENRGWVLTNNLKKEKHMVYLGYSEKDVIDRKEIALDSLNETIKQLNDLNSDFFDTYEFIYRPHPGTIAPDNLIKDIKIIDKYSIEDWLNVVEVNLVWSSTTIFESDAKGVPSIVYEPIDNLDNHRTFGIENYQKISNIANINDEIIGVYNKEYKDKKMYEKYIGKIDNLSVERTKDAINHILSNTESTYRANPINKGKMFLFKTLLFQNITKIVLNVGLLEKIKFPRSAYELRKDIPYRNK